MAQVEGDIQHAHSDTEREGNTPLYAPPPPTRNDPRGTFRLSEFVRPPPSQKCHQVVGSRKHDYVDLSKYMYTRYRL